MLWNPYYIFSNPAHLPGGDDALRVEIWETRGRSEAERERVDVMDILFIIKNLRL